MPETAKKIDAMISKGMSLIITIALGVSVWYLGGINGSIGKLNDQFSDFKIQSAKQDERQMTTSAAISEIKYSVGVIVSDINSIKIKQERTDEVITRHDKMLNDNRTCTNCESTK